MNTILNIIYIEDISYLHVPNYDKIEKKINDLLKIQNKHYLNVETVVLLPKLNVKFKHFHHSCKDNIKIYFYLDCSQMINQINDLIINSNSNFLYISAFNTINYYIFNKPNFNTIVCSNHNIYNICNELSNVLFETQIIQSNSLKISNHLNAYNFFKFFVEYIELINIQDITFIENKRNTLNNLLEYNELPKNLRYNNFKEFIQIFNYFHKSNLMNKNLEQYYNKIVFKQFNPSSNQYKDFILIFKQELFQYFNKTKYKLSKMQSLEKKLITSNLTNILYIEIFVRKLIRSFKRILKDPKKIPITMYELIFLKFPVKPNTFIFESFNGKNYTDNPKYLYEYLCTMYPNFKFIWVLNEEKNQKIPGNAKIVKRLSISYYYYYATSKYWISNTRLANNLIKKDEQIYVQTWHGTPLKKLALDMDEVLLANTNELFYKLKFMQEVERWDFLISPNDYSSDIFQSCFGINSSKILTTGYPRNDFIVKNKSNKVILEKIKNNLNIPANKKIILYAPTWRDDEFDENGKYVFNMNLDIQYLIERIPKDTILLIRLHYLIANSFNGSNNPQVLNVSQYPDIAELYLITDILITDYSSVFFDYSILNRPQIFYSYDIEKYENALRGFYLNYYNDLPGPIVKNENELVYWINEFLNINTLSFNKAWYSNLNKYEDGFASKKVIDIILNKSKEK